MDWLAELEASAAARLPGFVSGYFDLTAGDGSTHREGLRDWSALRFRPRMLQGGFTPSTETSVLGCPVATPVLIAPAAQQIAADPDGEATMAAGAAQAGSLLGVTTHTGVRFDRISAAGAPWWFQVYVMRDRGLTAELVRRARDAGARALIITVDLPSLESRRPEFEPANWPDRTLARRAANWDGIDPAVIEAGHATAHDLGPAVIGWLAQVSGLPVVVKGVLRADDAMAAVSAGAAGVIVSTHGGRALDRSITSPSALPAIARALQDSTAQVYVDSGIRSGADVLGALALGAHAVFVGRPALWGLATGGADGVRTVIDTLTAELRQTMKLAGVRSVDGVSADILSGHRERTE